MRPTASAGNATHRLLMYRGCWTKVLRPTGTVAVADQTHRPTDEYAEEPRGCRWRFGKFVSHSVPGIQQHSSSSSVPSCEHRWTWVALSLAGQEDCPWWLPVVVLSPSCSRFVTARHLLRVADSLSVQSPSCALAVVY